MNTKIFFLKLLVEILDNSSLIANFTKFKSHRYFFTNLEIPRSSLSEFKSKPQDLLLILN